MELERNELQLQVQIEMGMETAIRAREEKRDEGEGEEEEEEVEETKNKKTNELSRPAGRKQKEREDKEEAVSKETNKEATMAKNGKYDSTTQRPEQGGGPHKHGQAWACPPQRRRTEDGQPARPRLEKTCSASRCEPQPQWQEREGSCESQRVTLRAPSACGGALVPSPLVGTVQASAPCIRANQRAL